MSLKTAARIFATVLIFNSFFLDGIHGKAPIANSFGSRKITATYFDGLTNNWNFRFVFDRGGDDDGVIGANVLYLVYVLCFQ